MKFETQPERNDMNKMKEQTEMMNKKIETEVNMNDMELKFESEKNESTGSNRIELNESENNNEEPEKWKMKRVKNEKLLDEYGNELTRKLGLDDGQKRELMVRSVQEGVNQVSTVGNEKEMKNMTREGEEGWYPVNVGKSYISGDTVFNLYAAVPARRKGLGTVMPIGEKEQCYLFDELGHRYYMEEVGNQLRIKGRLYNTEGEYHEIELVHDSGAAATILKGGDAELWDSAGDGVVSMGGYTGESTTLVGGNELCLKLKASEPVEIEQKGGQENKRNEMTLVVILKEIAAEEQVELDEFEMNTLLVSTRGRAAAVAAAGAAKQVDDGNSMKMELETGEEMDQKSSNDDSGNKEEVDIELILEDMTPTEREWVMSKIKSAKSLKELIEEQQKNIRVKGSENLGKEMGLRQRVNVMREYSRKFPHLSMGKLNRMVKEGDIKGGVELREDARVKDEAYYLAKGRKARIHRKHSESREDPGKGYRAPFFMVELDLIDLTNETKGNRWGYKWLMVIVDKEYGTLKVYPLRGKDDVKIRWRQFIQWMRIIAPYVEAKLGVKPEVMIVGNDRGTEFMTTFGRRRGELDEELFKANIYRWSPTAGDSNKLGKVERMNGILMQNVNCMLRMAGATNEWTYYAVSMFEHHYNTTPTDGNIIGNGEAPYKTLGIPVNYDMMVRFMCPAFVRMPKNRDIKTGHTVVQTKLTQKLVKCFIVGYGGPFSQGCDHDGYKVVIPAAKQGAEPTIYSSNDVFPQEDLEITRSFLTGKVHDPLNEGKLVRRQFDLEGKESLTWIPQDIPHRDTESNSRESVNVKRINKMTVGTGATGQMRHEMDEKRVPQLVKSDIMSEKAARYRVAKARRKEQWLKYVEPSRANKRGACRVRYDRYWQCRTFNEYDDLCKRKDSALKSDLVHDVKKGFLVFEDNPDMRKNEGVSDSEDEFEWSRKSLGQGGGDYENVNRVGYMFGMSNKADHTRLQMRNIGSVNLTCDGSFDEEFILEVCRVAREELEEDKDVPLWLALAVYHRAAVYVGDRKQPYTIKEAMTLKEWPEWRAAVMKEISGLLAMGVWREVKRSELSNGTKVLPGRMVLEIKTKDGKFDKCKARYVSRGDLSNRGEHYYESSSHQVRSKSLKMFFATAVTEYEDTGRESKLPRNLDISQAYLSRKRTEHEPAVYMELPTDTFGLCNDKKSGYVAKMLRHLYGEVDGGRAFERELLEFMEGIGATATVSDRMVFIWKWCGHELKALAHVDDIIYNGSDDAILDEFFRLAEKHFGKLTGGGRAEYILGIKISWDLENSTVTLSQRAHVEKFLIAFGYDPCTTKKKDTPIALNNEITENKGRRVYADEWDTFMWVGFANWLVSMTRVDMAGVTNLIGRYANNPGEAHVECMRWAMRYLAGTMDLGLTFHGKTSVLSEPYDHKNKLIGYVDSMHGAGADTMCVVIMLNGAAVIWKVLKQRVVTTSTAHSEMIALAAGARELQWATDFMAEIGHEQGTVRLMGDNQSANLQATGDYKSSKSDHYRRIQFYVEDNVNQGVIWIDKVATIDNVADIGTKQVAPIAQFQRLRDIAQGVTPHVVLSPKVKEILNGMYDKMNNEV